MDQGLGKKKLCHGQCQYKLSKQKKDLFNTEWIA